MTSPPDEDPPPDEQWAPPGDTVALEPAGMPHHPLRASDAACFIAKDIG